MAVSGTLQIPASTPAMPTSAYAWGAATGTPASAKGTSAAPYADL